MRLRFVLTGPLPTTVAYAGEKAKWDVESEPFRSVLDVLTNQEADFKDLLVLWVVLMRRVRRTAPNAAAVHVTNATLKRWDHWPRGRAIVRGLLHSVFGGMFGEDSRTACLLWTAIYKWLMGLE